MVTTPRATRNNRRPSELSKDVEYGLDYPVPQTTAEPVKRNATSLPYTPRPSGQKSMTMRIIDTLFNGFGDEGGRKRSADTICRLTL